MHSRGAFFGAAFVRRVDGRFIWVHCSASSASRIHVRAMSIRISRTRAFGACAAIRWHSAARTLHLSAEAWQSPERTPRIYFQQNPAETGEEPAGFQMRLARYGLPKLAHKPGDPPKRSKKSVVRCYSPNFRQEILLFKLLNFCVQTIPEVTPQGKAACAPSKQ